jgi:hypothetical protein
MFAKPNHSLVVKLGQPDYDLFIVRPTHSKFAIIVLSDGMSKN